MTLDKIISRLILVGFLVGFLGLAIMGGFYLDPLLYPAEINAEAPSARSELRAIFGGGGLALVFACIYAWRSPDHRPMVFAMFALLFASFAAFRALSTLLDGPPNAHATLMQAVEMASALIAIVGWSMEQRILIFGASHVNSISPKEDSD